MPGFSIVRPVWAIPRPTPNFNFGGKEYPRLPGLWHGTLATNTCRAYSLAHSLYPKRIWQDYSGYQPVFSDPGCREVVLEGL